MKKKKETLSGSIWGILLAVITVGIIRGIGHD